MAWRRTSDKQLFEPMVASFTDANYKRHSALMSQYKFQFIHLMRLIYRRLWG